MTTLIAKLNSKYLIFTSLLMLVLTAYIGRDARVLKYHTLNPPKYPEIQLTNYAILNNTIFEPAEGFNTNTNKFELCKPELVCTQCWNAPLPCTYGNRNWLKQRGSSFKDGFIDTRNGK